ncbi:hypothetical protein BgAZ_105200 [Babesia gibsoni]|uniref:Uncharacterized protein n=1 Tax=Babesia gibsoni TaxID=33632 RepID=A0AAD8UVZ4_BABGI|nr:hypothetical protein BgAZ_105200 [Babesia gibsoni]
MAKINYRSGYIRRSSPFVHSHRCDYIVSNDGKTVYYRASSVSPAAPRCSIYRKQTSGRLPKVDKHLDLVESCEEENTDYVRPYETPYRNKVHAAYSPYEKEVTTCDIHRNNEEPVKDRKNDGSDDILDVHSGDYLEKVEPRSFIDILKYDLNTYADWLTPETNRTKLQTTASPISQYGDVFSGDGDTQGTLLDYVKPQLDTDKYCVTPTKHDRFAEKTVLGPNETPLRSPVRSLFGAMKNLRRRIHSKSQDSSWSDAYNVSTKRVESSLRARLRSRSSSPMKGTSDTPNKQTDDICTAMTPNEEIDASVAHLFEGVLPEKKTSGRRFQWKGFVDDASPLVVPKSILTKIHSREQEKAGATVVQKKQDDMQVFKKHDKRNDFLEDFIMPVEADKSCKLYLKGYQSRRASRQQHIVKDYDYKTVAGGDRSMLYKLKTLKPVTPQLKSCVPNLHLPEQKSTLGAINIPLSAPTNDYLLARTIVDMNTTFIGQKHVDFLQKSERVPSNIELSRIINSTSASASEEEFKRHITKAILDLENFTDDGNLDDDDFFETTSPEKGETEEDTDYEKAEPIVLPTPYEEAIKSKLISSITLESEPSTPSDNGDFLAFVPPREALTKKGTMLTIKSRMQTLHLGQKIETQSERVSFNIPEEPRQSSEGVVTSDVTSRTASSLGSHEAVARVTEEAEESLDYKSMLSRSASSAYLGNDALLALSHQSSLQHDHELMGALSPPRLVTFSTDNDGVSLTKSATEMPIIRVNTSKLGSSLSLKLQSSLSRKGTLYYKDDMEALDIEPTEDVEPQMSSPSPDDDVETIYQEERAFIPSAHGSRLSSSVTSKRIGTSEEITEMQSNEGHVLDEHNEGETVMDDQVSMHEEHEEVISSVHAMDYYTRDLMSHGEEGVWENTDVQQADGDVRSASTRPYGSLSKASLPSSFDGYNVGTVEAPADTVEVVDTEEPLTELLSVAPYTEMHDAEPQSLTMNDEGHDDATELEKLGSLEKLETKKSTSLCDELDTAVPEGTAPTTQASIRVPSHKDSVVIAEDVAAPEDEQEEHLEKDEQQNDEQEEEPSGVQQESLSEATQEVVEPDIPKPEAPAKVEGEVKKKKKKKKHKKEGDEEGEEKHKKGKKKKKRRNAMEIGDDRPRPLRHLVDRQLKEGFTATVYIVSSNKTATSSLCTVKFDYDKDKLVFETASNIFDIDASSVVAEEIPTLPGAPVLLKLTVCNRKSSAVVIQSTCERNLNVLGGTVGWAMAAGAGGEQKCNNEFDKTLKESGLHSYGASNALDGESLKSNDKSTFGGSSDDASYNDDSSHSTKGKKGKKKDTSKKKTVEEKETASKVSFSDDNTGYLPSSPRNKKSTDNDSTTSSARDQRGLLSRLLLRKRLSKTLRD